MNSSAKAKEDKKNKKMKRIIFFALAVLLCGFFVSCSKEAKLEKDIVGSWEQVRYWDNEEKEWYSFDDYEYTITYKFNNNETGTQIYKEKEDGYTETESFTYTIVDDRLSIRYKDNDYDESWIIESIKSKTMTWKDKDGDKLELKKK